VPKAVDCVECGIDLTRQPEIRHVSQDSGGRETLSCEAGVTVLHGAPIQIVAAYLESAFGESDEQASVPQAGSNTLRTGRLAYLLKQEPKKSNSILEPGPKMRS